jgi:predicted small metal-binding protein
MLIRYSCKDMGLNCDFVIKGEKMDEVIKKSMEHIREKHGKDFNDIRTQAEIVQMEQALMRSTRVVVS